MFTNKVYKSSFAEHFTGNSCTTVRWHILISLYVNFLNLNLFLTGYMFKTTSLQYTNTTIHSETKLLQIVENENWR